MEPFDPQPLIRAEPTKHDMADLASLTQLRNRIETVAHELTQLRKENHRLTKQIAELEGAPLELNLDEDPALLKEKVASFIHAIDQYLGREEASATS